MMVTIELTEDRHFNVRTPLMSWRGGGKLGRVDSAVYMRPDAVQSSVAVAALSPKKIALSWSRNCKEVATGPGRQ